MVTRSRTWRSWVTSTSPPRWRGDALLQPRDGVEVEVVGRLVEDQEHRIVVGTSPGPTSTRTRGQRDPLGLAARQPRHIGIDPRRHTDPVEHGLGFPAFAYSAAHRAGRKRRILIEEHHARPRPRRITPISASVSPARTRSSVVFPLPFKPTTARRSPLDTVTDTSAKSGRPGRLAERPAASTRIKGAPRVQSERREIVPPAGGNPVRGGGCCAGWRDRRRLPRQ